MRSAFIRTSLVCLLCAATLACGSDENRKAKHMERGDAYVEEKKFPEAVIEYRNVLQIDPNSAPAHWGLARAYIGSNKLREGYWELRETVRLDPANAEARLQYGQLSRLAGEHEEALAQAEAVIAVDAENMAAHLLKAQVLEAMKRFDEAKVLYTDTVQRFPNESAPLLLAANYYLRQGLRQEAEPYFTKLVEVKPSFSSWAALGGFLAQDPTRDAEAEAAYLKARELAGEQEQVLAERVIASFFYSRERFGDAEQVLKAALEKRPQDLDLIYVLARFYAARGDEARADAMIEEATRAKPDDVKPHLILSAYRGRKNDLEGALAAADKALEVDPVNLQARLRRAELLLDIGYREKDKAKIAQGRGIVDAVLSDAPATAEALFVKSKIELAENNADQAVADLRHALDLRPDWAEAHYLLGSALLIQRDLNGARAEITRALEIDGQLIEARKMLARVHALAGEHELAIEASNRVLKQRGDDVPTRLILAQELVRMERRADALAQLTAISEDKQTGETLYAQARIHRLNGDSAKARALFERANEKLPNHPEVLEALLQLDREENRIAESVQRIDAAVRAQPENHRLVHLQGLVQVLVGRGPEAEKSFRRAIELQPNDLAPYQSLAQYLAYSGRREEVLATYERAAAQRPDNSGLQLVLGSLHEAYGDTAKARETYEKAIQMDPNLAPAKNNLAYLLAESGDSLDRALDLAQEAKSLLPESGHAADTLGWVLFKKGIPSAAVSHLKEAEGLFRPDDPNLAIVRHHLAQAYEALGQKDEAREALRRALRDLEQIRSSYRTTTGKEPPEPPWQADLRAMLDRLEQQGG
jgi:tetratricopeptide (TPR) repeat protein